MSTRFYAGQQDYIVQLNLMDDVWSAGVASVTSKANKAGDTFTGDVLFSWAAPTVILEETDQAVDGKRWAIAADGGVFKIQARNDANSTTSTPFQISRAGTVTIPGTMTVTGTITGNISGNAGTVTNGVYTNTAQTISGQKTLSSSLKFTGVNFNINGNTSTADQIDGLYLTDLGTTQGTTLNPTFTAAIIGQFGPGRSVGFSAEGNGNNGYIWGYRSHSTVGSGYTWFSRVKEADKFTTARTINGVAFDGSANITVADSTKLPTTGGTINGNVSIAWNGGSSALEIGRTDGVANTPYIDFHSGATLVDWDARIIASGGTGAIGGGTLNFDATTLQHKGSKIVSEADNVVIPRGTVGTNSTNFDTITAAGTYVVSGNGTWTGSLNGPTTAYGFGQLIVTVNGTGVTQTYYAHNNVVYIRSKYNASDWTAWSETVNGASTQTISGAKTFTGENTFKAASQFFVANAGASTGYVSTIGGLNVYADDNGAGTVSGAVMSFHRPGVHAVNFGLDTDNVIRLGGWSDGAGTYRFTSDTSGNFWTRGGVTSGGVGTFKGGVTLQDATDATKQAQFVMSGITTATTRQYTLPNLSGTLATIGSLTQTFSGSTTFSNASNTFGNSTAAGTTNIASGATVSASTKILNLGTGGASGSTTTVNFGSSTSGATTTYTFNGTGSVTLPVGTTAQRTNVAGDIRFNSELNQFEGRTNSAWSALAGSIYGNKNKIINGKMDVAQRGASFTGWTQGSAYTLDRWLYNGGSTFAGAVTITQQADAPSDNEFQSSLRVAVTTADATMGLSDIVELRHRIEGYDARNLIGKTFTLSFRVRSSKTGVHCVAFFNSAHDRSYIMEYTVSAANTWETKTLTLPGGLITAGTWNWTNATGLQVAWVLACGTGSHGTANTWNTTATLATANQVNCMDTVGNIFAITGVQLEVGTEATPFEHRTYAQELALCQRYFLRVASDSWLWSGQVTSGNTYYTSLPYPVPMRAVPSVTNVTSSAQSSMGVPIVNGARTTMCLFQSGATATAATAYYYVGADFSADL